MVRDFTDSIPEIWANTRRGFVNRIYICKEQLGVEFEHLL